MAARGHASAGPVVANGLQVCAARLGVATDRRTLYCCPVGPIGSVWPYAAHLVDVLWSVGFFLGKTQGSQTEGERPLELLLSLIAGLSLLAWLMLVWGSASQAQIVGGFCTALGFLSLLVVLSLADLKGDLLGWVGPWFGWLALFAYYYLEIPWWVLLLNGMVFVSGYYGSSAGYMKPWSWKALGLRIVLLAILVGGLGFLALQVKPKSFY